MKERGILFSGAMVRAILEGRKSMTRRTRGLENINLEPAAWEVVANKGGGAWLFRRTDSCTFATVKCPYGVPVDRLWVRETHKGWITYQGQQVVQYAASGTKQYHVDRPEGHPEGDMLNGECCADKWRPSIHMPRWASRITLEITGVLVERLQDITEADAVAEGVEPRTREKGYTIVCRGGGTFEVSSLYERGVPAVGDASPFGEVTHVEPIPERVLISTPGVFRLLWMKINGLSSWEANPWVWVVEFKKVGEVH